MNNIICCPCPEVWNLILYSKVNSFDLNLFSFTSNGLNQLLGLQTLLRGEGRHSIQKEKLQIPQDKGKRCSWNAGSKEHIPAHAKY